MKIVTCYQSTDRHLEQIRNNAPGYEVIAASQQDLNKLLPEADIFLGHIKSDVDWDEVVHRGKLAWIQSSAAGMDHCLVPQINDSEISVCSASGLFANQVAEQALALTLGLLRGLPGFFNAQQNRSYQRMPTDDLHGKRVGILGMGGNGIRISQILSQFGCRTWATDVFFTQKPATIKKAFPPDDLAQVLQHAEILIITLPLLPETRHLIGEQELAQLNPGAYLINVGRGPVIDEAELIKCLQQKRLAGVGLDVAEIEPLPPESELWTFPNVIITPHVGAQSATRNDDVTDLFCENLRRYIKNDRQTQSLINLVDKSLGFPRPENRYDFDAPLK